MSGTQKGEVLVLEFFSIFKTFLFKIQEGPKTDPCTCCSIFMGLRFSLGEQQQPNHLSCHLNKPAVLSHQQESQTMDLSFQHFFLNSKNKKFSGFQSSNLLSFHGMSPRGLFLKPISNNTLTNVLITVLKQQQNQLGEIKKNLIHSLII